MRRWTTTRSKQDLEDTNNPLAEDTKFLADLKDKCANVDQEFEERTKTRTLEGLEYLMSDEVHALFTKTFNPAMLQLLTGQAPPPSFKPY